MRRVRRAEDRKERLAIEKRFGVENTHDGSLKMQKGTDRRNADCSRGSCTTGFGVDTRNGKVTSRYKYLCSRHASNCERERKMGGKEETHPTRCVVRTYCSLCHNCVNVIDILRNDFWAAFILSSSYINLVALPAELLVCSYMVRINGRLYRNYDIWIFLMSAVLKVHASACALKHVFMHNYNETAYRRFPWHRFNMISCTVYNFAIIRYDMLNYSCSNQRVCEFNRKMSLFVARTTQCK